MKKGRSKNKKKVSHTDKKDKLPLWKAKVNSFNEAKLAWLDRFVKKSIPWLVLILLFIIIGEFSGEINGFIESKTHHETEFWLGVEEFFHNYHTQVLLIDQIVIGFFVIDLYFNFFKTAKLIVFFKKYFIDILAVTPVGLFFRGSEVSSLAGVAEEVSLGQGVTHVATETERVIVEAERSAKAISEAERTGKAISEVERAGKALTEAEKTAKVVRLSRTARTARIVGRLPRVFRVFRIRDFFKKKKR